ncbi:MAG: signal peptide peptidase SppA [Candidatus Hydrothermarchaeales archaeon]
MKKTIAILGLVIIILLGISVLAAYILTKPMDSGSLKFGDKVAVIKVEGVITMSDGAGFFGVTGANPTRIIKQIKKANDDSSVKAILFEINSPGGGIVASEAIAEAIKDVDKPTVAWLSEIATSGGYYVASSCDYIVADRGTLTGSIGVISMFPQYSSLLEKMGVEMRVIKSGEYKDIGSPFRNMTGEERSMIQEWNDEIYNDFVSFVAENRGLSREYVEEIAEGKLYVGKKAVELKLADEIGTKEDAIAVAGRMGGIEGEPTVVEYKRGTFFDDFIGTASARFGYGFAKGLIETNREATSWGY